MLAYHFTYKENIFSLLDWLACFLCRISFYNFNLFHVFPEHHLHKIGLKVTLNLLLSIYKGGYHKNQKQEIGIDWERNGGEKL